MKIFYCRVLIVNEKKGEFFVDEDHLNESKRLTKLYQYTGAVPRIGDIVDGSEIIDKASDHKFIYLIVKGKKS